MILKSIKFTQHEDEDRNAWYLEPFDLGLVNLIVGKNATGKTRTLNIIGNMANMLGGDVQKLFADWSEYELVFDNAGKTVQYSLGYRDRKVCNERLRIDKKMYLSRGEGGKGRIWAKQLKDYMVFQAPEDQLASVARRDSVQHPFFDDLYEWGQRARHYYFGSQLGKDMMPIYGESKTKEAINLKDTNKVVGLLKVGLEKYSKVLQDAIKQEMNRVGYKIEEVGVVPARGIRLEGIPGTLECIYVKESDLRKQTYQTEISQGMFRALSLIIQLNVSQLDGTSDLVIIDDIGEGLDFDRATLLIKLLIEKAEKSHVQLIMSTNDRFVMNNVPLEYWSVIQRIGSKCKIFNYANSKKIFDDFQFTGLANFDFLSTGFYLNGFKKKK